MAFDYSTVDLEAILQRAYNEMDNLQRPAVSKAKKSGRVIFDMYMGTGKTFAALTSGLCFMPQRWIIICSKNAINAFRQEIKKWFPEFADPSLFSICRGTKAEREAAYKSSGLFFITTGASFIRDLDFLVSNNIGFDVVTIDEADKVGLRNRKTQAFKGTAKLVSNKHYENHKKRILKIGKVLKPSKVSLVNICTGTLTAKGVPQLYGYLHLMDPKLFSSYWKFIGTFMHVVDGPFGKVPTVPKNTEALAQATYDHIYRVTEKDAKDVLPPLRRIKLPFELSPRIRNLYNSMAEELYFHWENAVGEQNLQAVNSTLAQSIKLRQLITCPGILDPALGPGDAIEAIAEKMLETEEYENFTHNVVFTPFLKAIPIFKSYLSTALNLPPELIYTMQGGMEPEAVQEVEHNYRNNPRSLIVCSTMFAASFNLETGLNAYHAHFSWNQDENKQAEGRLRRKTSDKSRTIMSYYAHVPDSVSDVMFDVLNGNTHTNNITYQDFDRIKRSLTVRL